jgi:hypothetical protein
VIQFGNNGSLPGVWIAAATSLALGNIEIDQAVVSTIAARIAAVKVTLVRMTPISGLVPRRISFGACGARNSVNRLTQTGDYFAQAPRRPRISRRGLAPPKGAGMPARARIEPDDFRLYQGSHIGALSYVNEPLNLPCEKVSLKVGLNIAEDRASGSLS